MHEEPFRWAEAIANRREYIEHQLSSGSPVIALSYDAGILLLTFSRDRRKIFEIYDAIAMGAMGHPGDIERLRMAAIETTSAEGFARSAQDVSLRRLAHYSLSPALKAAFEQVYGPPYLARLLFAELGRNGAPDLFLRLDYDGAIHANQSGFGEAQEMFGVASPTAASALAAERWLQEHARPKANVSEALHTAGEAWAMSSLAAADVVETPPNREKIREHFLAQLKQSALEVMLIERDAPPHLACRSPEKSELEKWLKTG